MVPRRATGWHHPCCEQGPGGKRHFRQGAPAHGAGDYPEEAAGLGLPFPPLAERFGQLRWLAGMGIETVYGWVVGVDQITPIEVMGREVIPAAAAL